MTDFDYVRLGPTGLRVSEYALGTMTFGEDWGWGAPQETAGEIFDAYVEAGGNFIDTAVNYTNGSSERIVGELVADKRDEYVIATKYTISTRDGDPNASGNQRKNMFQSVEASLDRLGTDYIDLLWVHAWDGITPIEEVMRGLDDLVRMGKVHHIGLSDFPAWVVARAQTLAEERDYPPVAALQIKYNLLERTVERELLPMADELDIAVTAWGPLESGILTGKYLDSEADGRVTKQGREITEHQRNVAQTVVDVAADLDVSPAQVALAWIREGQGQILPILGATKPDQLADNIASYDLSLPADHRKQLDEVSAIEMGFPHDFLNGEVIRNLVYGGLQDRIDGV